MIDFNKPVQTKNGCPVRIFMTDAGGLFPVLGAIQLRTGYFYNQAWTSEGKAYMDIESSVDLINVPECFSIERWINVYLTKNEELHTHGLFSSRKEAEDMHNLYTSPYITYCGTYKVVIEGEIK